MKDNDKLFKPTLMFDAMLLDNGDIHVGDKSHETPGGGDDGDLDEFVDTNIVDTNILE